MTQFSIGTTVFEQIRGSPMGSPLSPALCMMVVALSEEIWYRTYRTTLSTMDLTARLLRYVDNRLCFVGPLLGLRNLLRQFPSRSSTVIPSFWKRNRTRSSWAFASSSSFCPSLQPSTRLQPGHGAILRIPLAVQLSGFVSRLFLVAKCAHPAHERTRGFAALHRLYRSAGFTESDLAAAAKPIRQYLHVPHCGKILNSPAASAYVSLFISC